MALKKSAAWGKGGNRMLRKMTIIGVCTCGYVMSGCKYPQHIQVTPEPWRTMPLGQPLDTIPPVHVIEEGKGPVIGMGFLVKLNLSRPHYGADNGNWWVWTGFIGEKDTPYANTSPLIASTLVGMREGSLFEYIATGEHKHIGVLEENVVGNPALYSWKKIGARTGMIAYGSTPAMSGTYLKILTVCKADLQVRTVHLYDDSPVSVSSGGFTSYTTREPREMWADEMRITGPCSDGRNATFQSGPVPSARKTGGRSPVFAYWDTWFKAEWNKVPMGVCARRPDLDPPCRAVYKPGEIFERDKRNDAEHKNEL